MSQRVRMQQQMTLEVGHDPDELPMTGAYAVSGKLHAIEELKKGSLVTVSIANADGVIVAHGSARLGFVGFKECEVDGVKWTERQHRVKMISPK